MSERGAQRGQRLCILTERLVYKAGFILDLGFGILDPQSDLSLLLSKVPELGLVIND
jgi:hypothetical protein